MSDLTITSAVLETFTRLEDSKEEYLKEIMTKYGLTEEYLVEHYFIEEWPVEFTVSDDLTNIEVKQKFRLRKKD